MTCDEFFYFSLIRIKVENTLFCVPRELLERNSDVFKDLFALPTGASEPDGHSNEKPLFLDGIREDEFRIFLSTLYPIPVNRRPLESELEPALKLATMWNFSSMRNGLILKLSEICLPPARRLELARTYNIPHWFVPALQELALRDEGLTLKEAEMLGLKLTHTFSCLRDTRYKQLMESSGTFSHRQVIAPQKGSKYISTEITVQGSELEKQAKTGISEAIDKKLQSLATESGWME